MRFSQSYKPLYFLAALGAGGLSITFFMYLMFLTKHPTSPIPTFDTLRGIYADGSIAAQALATVAVLGIIGFAARHFQLLVLNLRSYRAFKRTDDYTALRKSNAEVSLMAIPLTLGMTINVSFILGALFVPGLWDVVEYAFPFALIAFAAVGLYGFHVFGRYLGRMFSHRGFDIEDTNHFSQVLPSFAFAMIGVGFAAPAAMSHTLATSVIGMLGSLVFVAAALAWAFIKLPVSVSGMLRHGMSTEASPTLWMGIPILTLLGITYIRISAGVSHTILDVTFAPIGPFVVLGMLVALQVVMLLGGAAIMARLHYFRQFVFGPRASIAAYGLICPGVAFNVLFMFFAHWGLVKNGIVAAHSPLHYGLVAAAAVVQVVTIATLVLLDRKLMSSGPATTPQSSAAPALAH